MNPTNSDVYTVEMAEFVDTFGRLAMPDYLPHCSWWRAARWASRTRSRPRSTGRCARTSARASREEKGHQVLHFREAFHGRSGYTPVAHQHRRSEEDRNTASFRRLDGGMNEGMLLGVDYYGVAGGISNVCRERFRSFRSHDRALYDHRAIDLLCLAAEFMVHASNERQFRTGQQHFDTQQPVMRSGKQSLQLKALGYGKDLFGRLSADVATLVQHAINGGNANTGEFRNVLKSVLMRHGGNSARRASPTADVIAVSGVRSS